MSRVDIRKGVRATGRLPTQAILFSAAKSRACREQPSPAEATREIKICPSTVGTVWVPLAQLVPSRHTNWRSSRQACGNRPSNPLVQSSIVLALQSRNRRALHPTLREHPRLLRGPHTTSPRSPASPRTASQHLHSRRSEGVDAWVLGVRSA